MVTDSREHSGDDSNADRAQPWVAPGYGVIDLHANYKLPFAMGAQSQLYFYMSLISLMLYMYKMLLIIVDIIRGTKTMTQMMLRSI